MIQEKNKNKIPWEQKIWEPLVGVYETENSPSLKDKDVTLTTLLIFKFTCFREESCLRWPPEVTFKLNLPVIWCCECKTSTIEPA